MDGEGFRYSRGYLPHIDVGSRPQFLTWRLADSVPAELIEQWKAEIAREYRLDKARKRELWRRLELYLDQCHGSCLLRNPVAAHIVHETLIHYHGKLYALHEWVVMPNHVHVLLTPNPGVSLADLVQANKSFTSHEINRKLGRNGRLWQVEYFDRFIRDEVHFAKVGTTFGGIP